MTPQEYEALKQKVEEAKVLAETNQHYTNQEIEVEGQERSMISEQLNLGDELDRIDYLLRGYTIERNENTGSSKWVKPKDNDMIVLSDYGVHLIRNTIAWYLNKNTLLSNFDEKTIMHKMEDFSSDLNDTIFMEYEKVFQYPTLEDCRGVLDKRIKDKVTIRKYAYEIMGTKMNDIQEDKIKQEVLKEIEPIIEKELTKIKEQIIKNKLKRFLILIREVQDAVHSTYMRAWKGLERQSLRQHMHVSESKGLSIPVPQERDGFMSRIRKR